MMLYRHLVHEMLGMGNPETKIGVSRSNVHCVSLQMSLERQSRRCNKFERAGTRQSEEEKRFKLGYTHLILVNRLPKSDSFNGCNVAGINWAGVVERCDGYVLMTNHFAGSLRFDAGPVRKSASSKKSRQQSKDDITQVQCKSHRNRIDRLD